MSRIYRQFRDRVATVRMSRSEFRSAKLDALIETVDLTKLDTDKLLTLIDAKIDKLRKLENTATLVSLGATLLLFASLYGVDFEIDFLGVKLSGLQKLKELIFCGVAFAGVIVVAATGSTKHLKSIRKRLFVRLHGKAAYEVYAPTFNDDLSYDFDIPMGPEKYYPTRPTMVLEGIRIFLELLPMFVGAAAALFVTVFIAFDIWANSNLPDPWGKVLVGVVYVSWVLQFLMTAFSHVWKFHFIDVAKEKDIEVKDPKTGDLHPILDLLIKRKIFFSRLRSSIAETVLVAMVATALAASGGWFKSILDYVQSTVNLP
jgi:hypothetical protein